MSRAEELALTNHREEVQDFGRIDDLDGDKALEEIELSLNPSKTDSPGHDIPEQYQPRDQGVREEAPLVAPPQREAAWWNRFQGAALIGAAVLTALIWLFVTIADPYRGALVLVCMFPALAFLGIAPKIIHSSLKPGQPVPSWVSFHHVAGLFFEGFIVSVFVVIVCFFAITLIGAIFFGSNVTAEEFFVIDAKTFFYGLIISFLILAPAFEYAKYRITKTAVVDRIRRTPSRVGYAILTASAAMGLASMEAVLVSVMMGYFYIAVAQILVSIPFHMMTGVSIGLGLASKSMLRQRPPLWKLLLVPILCQGLMHMFAYLMVTAEAPLWAYWLGSFLIMLFYIAILRRQWRNTPESFVLVDEEAGDKLAQEA